MSMERREIMDDLEQLLDILPEAVRRAVETERGPESLIEIVLDLGRPAEARYVDRYAELGGRAVTHDDLQAVLRRVGRFGPDNRAGIERTLHRISAIRNRQGEVVGITCRVGRAVFGTIHLIRDVVERGASTLLLGRPGVGKTTMLREMARVMADDFGRRVIVVDTSNEIAGDGDVPHPAIGRARRMQVPLRARQADVMIEAVENHMPEVIVIDEIGTSDEAEAARTIAERGVQLIGTAHGNKLENLILNPTLSDLIGGIHAVTLSDDEAKRRGSQKTVLERKAPPTFDVLIEIQEKEQVAVHHDVAKTVDLWLRGIQSEPEVRCRSGDGKVDVVQISNLEDLHAEAAAAPPLAPRPAGKDRWRIFPYAVSRNRLEKAIKDAHAPLELTRVLDEADVILTLKGQYRKMPKKLREAEERGLPIRIVRSNTHAQVQSFVDSFDPPGGKRRASRNQAR